MPSAPTQLYVDLILWAGTTSGNLEQSFRLGPLVSARPLASNGTNDFAWNIESGLARLYTSYFLQLVETYGVNASVLAYSDVFRIVAAGSTSTTAPPASATSNRNGTNSEGAADGSSSNALGPGAVAGVAVGVVIAVLLIWVAIFFLRRQWGKRRGTTAERLQGGTTTGPEADMAMVWGYKPELEGSFPQQTARASGPAGGGRPTVVDPGSHTGRHVELEQRQRNLKLETDRLRRLQEIEEEARRIHEELARLGQPSG